MTALIFVLGAMFGAALGLLTGSLVAAARDYDEPQLDDWQRFKDDTDWRREVLEARMRRLDERDSNRD